MHFHGTITKLHEEKEQKKMEKQKDWCHPEREINPHTIFLKKMAHLLLHKCYIHIVISVTGTENPTSHCWFLMCINNTLKYLTQEQIFYAACSTQTHTPPGNASNTRKQLAI